MKYSLPFVVAVVMVSGCATTTGIVPTGQNAFMISKDDNSLTASVVALKADVYKEAAGYCSAQGKSFSMVSESDTPRALGQIPRTTLHFTCT
jgi:uracil DNA glycosylase